MPSDRSSTRWVVCAALAAAVLAVFGQTGRFEFVDFDDDRYVYENPRVRQGLSAGSVAWAFRSTAVQNWHPVTWLSHMADVQVLGVDAGRHHLVNVLLHALNAVLLFLALLRMTGAAGRSGIVAALFALHPLHVESVAWVAERKDLLSTFFGLVAIWSYARYVERRTLPRYAGVAVPFALGLMAKPMLVTLPFLLLLLDVWPLRRLSPGADASAEARPSSPARLVLEKLPLLVLAAASSAVTLVAQRSGGAVVAADVLPLGTRLANALVSYVRYLEMALWPRDLAVYYPYPGTGPAPWKVVAAASSLAAVTVLSLRLAKRAPWVAVGWLWYLGTLVPVIGLVQVGGQALADRYTYLPLIGIFILVAWAVPARPLPWKWSDRALRAGAIAALAALSVASWRQAAVWESSETLFTHALAVTTDNWMAHTNLGKAQLRQGRLEEATRRFETALAIKPDQPITLTNLGTALGRAGKPGAAGVLFRRALQIDPAYGSAWYNLGVTLLQLQRWGEAAAAFGGAIRRDPDDRWSLYYLGLAEQQAGRLDDAASALAAALRIAPDDVAANTAMGVVLAQMGRLDDAISRFLAAARLDPGNASVRANLDAALRARSRR